MSLAPVLLIVSAQVASASGSAATGLPFEGDAALDFLQTAEIVSVEYFDNTGTTKPRKVTLSNNGAVHFAIFKTVDEFENDNRLASTRSLHKYHDSYRHEIAAWELGDLIGLDLVPPCVERELKGETGSLCMWVEEASTARQLKKQGRFQPPDRQPFEDQADDIRLFIQLAWDAEYNHGSNILIDGSWRLYKIDSSRSFRADSKLRKQSSLTRFRRSTIQRLEKLTEADFQERLGPWLDEDEVEAVWKRRNKILKLAQSTIEERGEGAVLY